MSPRPFFSVLIPTKNRAHLVCHAIQSVLNQTFEDSEIILVDNDDSDDTEDVVSQLSDHRLRYVKTGGLSMPDNWEFALQQARGRYITVLEDKQAYYPWALESLHRMMETAMAQIAIWNWDASEQMNNPQILTMSDFELTNSEDAIRQYVSGELPWRMSPRLLNSCAPRELLEIISNRLPERRFFIPFSPDLCAAFAQLSYVDKLFYTPKALGYMSASESNAISYRKARKNTSSYYAGKQSIDLRGAVSLVPIKNHLIIHNTVYNDFLRVRELLGGNLDQHEMQPQAYSQMCLSDVILTLRVGGSCLHDLKDIHEYMQKNVCFYGNVKLWAWFFSKWLRWKVAISTRWLMRRFDGKRIGK